MLHSNQPIAQTMDPGAYNPHPQFGSNTKKFTMGAPYEFKADKNPPPGYYDLESAWKKVKPKVAAP